MDEEKLLELFKEDNLPTIPSVTSELLNINSNSDISFDSLALIIGRDPALALQILKIANSAFYGGARNISSVQTAITVIGLERITQLAISFSVKNSFVDIKALDFNIDNYWRRAVLSSCVGSFLAQFTDSIKPEDALLASLLQDIGILVFVMKLKEKYWSLENNVFSDHAALAEFELILFGISHNELSARLLAYWNFPNETVNAILNSHKQNSLKDVRDLSWCVAGSNLIVEEVLLGLQAGNLSESIRLALSNDWIEISAPRLDAFTLEILELVAVSESIFEINIDDKTNGNTERRSAC